MELELLFLCLGCLPIELSVSLSVWGVYRGVFFRGWHFFAIRQSLGVLVSPKHVTF